MFQKNAIGKFFRTVPAQMAGSWLTGMPAIIILNKIAAAILMAGHITAMVPA